MKHKYGGFAGWIFLGIVLFATVGLIMTFVSYANNANRTEKKLLAVWENNENILAQYSLKIQEMAQIPDMYTEDLTKLYKTALEGRYGSDGSKAMWQWLKEKNPDLPATFYTKLQTVMEEGRNRFENGQTEFVDIKRGYETALGNIPDKWFLSIAGYPTIDLTKYKIITSDHAQDAFKTGVDKGVKLRPKE